MPSRAGVCTSLWLILYSVSYYMSTGMQGSACRCDCYYTCVSHYSITGVQGLYIATTYTVPLCLIIWVLACTSHYMSTGMQGSARRYDCYWTLSLIRWVSACRGLYVAMPSVLWRKITTPAPTSSVRFLGAGCPSWHPTNSVKALKANVTNVPVMLQMCLER